MKDHMQHFDTEEDLKSSFLVPLLKRIGINYTELKFEKSFRLFVGRQKLTEKVTNGLKEHRPRLDILVTRNKQNAFIIEVKRTSHPLHPDDRDQAVSYARLLHPIAPYAIVTNGSDTKIYDSISREEIHAKDIVLEHGYEPVLPNEDDFDALECFLRLSSNNLLRYSKQQVQTNTQAIIGSKTDSSKKYIPDLHLPREYLEREIYGFLKSDKPTFALIGDSGIGKTCSFCYQIGNLISSKYLVLFYRGSELMQNIVENIVDDFGWVFTDNLSPSFLVKRLSHIVGDKNLLIFIDAIDEWDQKDAYRQLGYFSKHLVGTKLKLLLSCKASIWPNFIQQRKIPTDLEQFVYKTNKDDGFVLNGFSDEEFHKVFYKYKKFFKFDGQWDRGLLDEARRNPFFMRIAFETASHYKFEDLRESSIEIYESYYQRCICNTLDGFVPDISENILIAIAKVGFQDGIDQVDSSRIRIELGMSAVERFPEDLFRYGVLEKVVIREGGTQKLKFVFEGLKNYVLLFKALNWHEFDQGSFQSCVNDLLSEDRIDIFNFYYNLASPSHKRILDKQSYVIAQNLLHSYQSIILKHFSRFAFAFPKGDPANLGLALEVNLAANKQFAYGLYKVREGNEKITILPISEKQETFDALGRVGAQSLTVRVRQNGLHNINTDVELLQVNICRMVYKIIRDGNLNEETAPDLSRELLAAVVTSLPELLDQPNYSFTKKNFPIKAKTIKYWVLFQQYWRVLRRELIDEKVISGEIEVDWKGSSASYSVPPLSLDEREKIRRKCDQLIKENAPINGRTIPDDDIAERLKKAVSALNNDDEIVMGPLFPDAQNLFERGVDADMEIELAQEYLCHFIKKFLDNYQSLIEHNFPTLKQYFPLYATMPVHVKTIIRKEKNESLLQSSVTLVFLMPEDKSGKDINLSEPAESEFTASEIRDWWPEGGLNFNGRKYRTWSVSSGDIKRFYQTYPRYPDIGQSPRDTPLRDFTYDWIFGELPEVFPELGKMYNTELNPSSF